MSQGSRSPGPNLNSALWLATGAAAGIVVGILIADKVGGRRQLSRRLSGVLDFVKDWAASEEDDETETETEIEGEIEGEMEEEMESGIDGEMDDEYDPDDSDDEYELDEDAAADEALPRIDERVLAAFEQDPILAERSIEIDEPEPATIVLDGRVPTSEDAQHAVTIARGVPGVERVENYLRVRGGRPRPAPRKPPGA